MRRIIVVLSLLAAACASSNRPPNPGRPAVDVVQRGMIFFGSGSTAPLSVQVQVRNVANAPIVIQRVRVDPGAGMGQYSVYPIERILNQTLQPGETTSLNLTMTAYTNLSRLTPTEPLSVRAFVDYVFGEKRHRELYMYRDIREYE